MRWAEALAVERQFGERAPDHIAAQIRTLALQGDAAGVARWMDIAVRFDLLMGERNLVH